MGKEVSWKKTKKQKLQKIGLKDGALGNPRSLNGHLYRNIKWNSGRAIFCSHVWVAEGIKKGETTRWLAWPRVRCQDQESRKQCLDKRLFMLRIRPILLTGGCLIFIQRSIVSWCFMMVISCLFPVRFHFIHCLKMVSCWYTGTPVFLDVATPACSLRKFTSHGSVDHTPLNGSEPAHQTRDAWWQVVAGELATTKSRDVQWCKPQEMLGLFQRL